MLELQPSRLLSARRYGAMALALALFSALPGCESRDQIRRYQAAKIVAANEGDEAAQTQRMLAAIVSHEAKTWFFKMVGPDDAVQSQSEDFRKLIQSLEFASGKPKWALPEGWKETAASGIRFATLKTKAGDTDLELTVISLPNPPDGDDRAYQLANINRWRGQLQLPPLSADALDDASEQIDFQGGQAILVDIVGKSNSDGGMGRPPFAGVGAGPRPRPPAPRGTLRFDKPEDWQEGKLVVSRGGITLRHEAAFVASDGDQQVEVTVDRMPAGGSLLANVNRWRRQVGLPPQDEAALRDSVQQLDLAGQTGEYVQFAGADESILGVIIERDDEAWFVKLKGNKELADAQREPFEAFVRSIRFE